MKNIRFILSENFMFLEVEFSIYLNRHVFVMNRNGQDQFTHRDILCLSTSRSSDFVSLSLQADLGLRRAYMVHVQGHFSCFANINLLPMKYFYI